MNNLLDALIAAKLAGGGGGGGGGGNPHAVLYTAQTLSDEQQAQARENIGAGEPLTDQQIADAAGAWLDDNITNPSSPPIDKSLSVSNAAADAKIVGDILYGEADPTPLPVSPWTLSATINGSGQYITGTAAKSSATADGFYNVYPASEIYQTGPGKDANDVPLHTWVHEYDANGNWLRRTGLGSETTKMTVGQDCKMVRFVFLRLSSTGITMTQAAIQNYFSVAITPGYGKGTGGLATRVEMLEAKAALGLHTVPATQGVANLIRRCRQMTDIEWTPAVDLPRYMLPGITPPASSGYSSSLNSNYIGVFKAGTKYRGIPYGRCTDYLSGYGLDNSYVGSTIDFGTFITAVRNANSLISKESAGSVALHHSIPYAAVCSALTCYALNVAYVDTTGIPSISGLNEIGAIINNGERIDPTLIKLGDVLNRTNYHTSVITDIVKDADGNVTALEISEATTVGEDNRDIEGGQVGGLCRRYGLAMEDFYNAWGTYTLYRYANIDSIPYTPSPFVQVGDELNYQRHVDLPCMPYQGNGFKFKSGHIPNTKILVNATGYGFMRVFKDGSEITGSPFTVAAGAEYVEVGFSEAGNYEAYLCNMSGGSNTEVTAKCNWTVESA